MADDPRGDDIVELGSRWFRLPDWRPSRGASLLAVAALVVGLAARYAAGDQHAWLTVTFKVQLRCPGPAPVEFSVGHLHRGHSAASLPGFPDLSQVPYSGCPPPTANSFSAQIVTAIN